MKLRTPGDALLATWDNDWATRPGYLTPSKRGALPNWTAQAVSTGDTDVGIIAFCTGGGDASTIGRIGDVWVLPEHRNRGHAREAVALAEARCRSRSMTELRGPVDPADPVQSRLFARYAVRSRRMTITVDADAPRPELSLDFALMDAEAFGVWRERSIVGYAELDANASPAPAEALDRSRREFAELLPDGRDTTGHELWNVTADGRAVGDLWLFHNVESAETFVFDIEVVVDSRGKGYGRQIMRFAEQRAKTHGLPRVGLHVHEHNSGAKRLYERLGYRTVTEYRSRTLTTG